MLTPSDNVIDKAMTAIGFWYLQSGDQGSLVSYIFKSYSNLRKKCKLPYCVLHNEALWLQLALKRVAGGLPSSAEKFRLPHIL
jgi:hypothetical protein